MPRTLKLTVAYDGTRYAGWQVQANADQTIQGTLEAALARVVGERVRVIGSGRTDAGVHALAQVAHCRLKSRMPAWRLVRAVAGVLPHDVVVTDVQDAPDDFHARYQASSKRYRYRIVTGPVVLPFDRRYVHQVWVPLDVALMRRELAVIRGRHDFRPFHKAGRVVHDARRTMFEARLQRRGKELVIELEADGFLQGMARSIVGTLLNVGRGYHPPGTMRKILRGGDRRLAGPTAPAKGLCLVQVFYGPRPRRNRR